MSLDTQINTIKKFLGKVTKTFSQVIQFHINVINVDTFEKLQKAELKFTPEILIDWTKMKS